VTHRPEVVDKQVENAENDHEHDRTPLGLEADHDHDAGNKANQDDDDPPKAPVAGKDEADEQENEQHSPSQLKIHLAILLINLRQSSRRELLPHPRVRQHHQQASNDGEITEKEVQVEDEAVAESLCDDNPEETSNSNFAALADDDEKGTDGHRDDVYDEEEVRKTRRD